MTTITGTAESVPGNRRHQPRRPESLGHQSCVELLGRGRLGRVIYTSGAMPAAQPVTYRMDRDEIVFYADRDSVLDLAVAHAVVAFEVDDIDLHDQHGWSVLAVGQAYRVTDIQRLADLDGKIPHSIWNGPVTTILAIPVGQLTGRRVRMTAADN